MDTTNQMSTNSNPTSSGRSIMRSAIVSLLALSIAGVAFAGCAETGPNIDRTQANLVDKSIFEGEWWYTRAVQQSTTTPRDQRDRHRGLWPGAMANFDIARAPASSAGSSGWSTRTTCSPTARTRSCSARR